MTRWMSVLAIVLTGCAGNTGTDSPSRPVAQPGDTPATQPGSTTQMTPDEFSDRQWQNRLLVIFADEESDLRLDEQRREMGPMIAQMRDRDVMMVEIVGQDPLRETLGVGNEGFHVVLVGKDGGVKLRSEAPVRGARIVSLIDSMPMRQDEVKRRGS